MTYVSINFSFRNSRIDEIRLLILWGLGKAFLQPFCDGGFAVFLIVEDAMNACP